MLKDKQYKKGVRQIVDRTRECNPLIGLYDSHFLTGLPKDLQIVIILTNGELVIPVDAAQIQEDMPQGISVEWVREIAQSFEHQVNRRVFRTQLRSGNDKAFLSRLLGFFRRS